MKKKIKNIVILTTNYDQKKSDGVSEVIFNIIKNSHHNKNFIFNFEVIDKKNFFKKIKFFFKEDTFHFHGCWHPIFIIFYLLRYLNKKIYLNTHGMLSKSSFAQKPFQKKLIWFFYQKKIVDNCNIIFVNSEKELVEVRNLTKNRINKINNGLVFSDLLYNKKKINTKKINFFFFSRLHKSKGIEDLLDAWGDINFAENESILRIYATGKEKYVKYIKEKIKNNRNNKSIFFYNNKLPSKKQIFKNNDVMILPSKSESFGIVILEALYSGNYVITTQNTPWKNDIHRRLYIIKNKKKAIVNVIQNCINHSNKVFQKSSTSKFNYKIYSWKKIVHQYLEFF